MSKQRRQFGSEFKTKVVLELLSGEMTLNQVSSKYEVLPKSLQEWKKQFLENTELEFEPAFLYHIDLLSAGHIGHKKISAFFSS